MAGGTVESQSGLASALKIFIHLYNPHVKNHLLLKKKKKIPLVMQQEMLLLMLE